MSIKLSFLGAAQNVTGSKYLLEANGSKFIIDYGIYQEHDLKDRNWEPAAVPVSEISGVFLTHAHLDHCGLLPRLVKEGYRGPIYGTDATVDLSKIVIADCAKINMEDALFKQKRHEKEGRKGPHPEMPLYTLTEASAVNGLFREKYCNVPFDLGNGISAEFFEAGHILGSSCIKFTITDGAVTRTVVFSGDVGRCDMPIVRDPAMIGDADYIVCESTYGNRIHGPQENIPDRLAEVINNAVNAGGNLIIPSFAIERTQDLIYYIAQLLKEDKIPHLRIFVDSPMAVKVTDIFKKHPDWFDSDTARLARSIRLPGLTLVRSTADSKSINRISGTAVIIAGSGMCTGGRIKHHLVSNLPRKQSTIMFVGYQAIGTLGRSIIDGASSVRILGQQYPVNAKIETISGFSAHADQQELITWLKTGKNTKKIFVTHGEPDASKELAAHIKAQLGCDAHVPEYKETVILE